MPWHIKSSQLASRNNWEAHLLLETEIDFPDIHKSALLIDQAFFTSQNYRWLYKIRKLHIFQVE